MVPSNPVLRAPCSSIYVHPARHFLSGNKTYRSLQQHQRHHRVLSQRRVSLPPVSSFFSKIMKGSSPNLPEVVEAGDPVLSEPAAPVPVEEITSTRIQSIIDDMVAVMRASPGVGLAAPQIGIPLQIIVLEDKEEYISYVSKEEADAQQRSSFDLLVICNPVLKKKGNKSAIFFEGCISVQGYRALVERSLEVEVTGHGRDGSPIKVDAIGWKARILQHEYDHLQGTLYVDKMVPKTFRTTNNLKLPLAAGCPRPGVHAVQAKIGVKNLFH